MTKNIIPFLLALFLAIPIAASAQAGTHAVQLTWTQSTDTGGTVNVYRASGSCAANASPTIIKTGVVPAGPYVDNGLLSGTFCYWITAVVGGLESLPSNKISVPVVPGSPVVTVIVVTSN